MFSSSNIKSKVIIMKKQIFSLGLMLAAAFTLTNCVKEEANFQQPESEGTPFEIVASTVATKTVNNELATEWVAGDAINLFHAVTDATTYTNDGKFSIAEADLEAGKFKGTLNGTLDAQEEYDWYAFYPYVSQITTPVNTTSYVTVGAKTNSTQTQNGNNSMAHIAGENYPLAGVAYATPANSTPSIKMAHVTSLLEVVVTNNTDEPLTVEEVMVNAPELLVGTYYIKFNGEITPASFTSSGESYTSTTAKLAVTNGEAIAKGASASFYLAVKPFVAAAGSKIEIYVNGAVKELTLGADVTFAAGHVKTLNYSYEATEVAGPETPTVAEFLAKEVNAAVWYQLTGTITSIANTSYGNFDLTDETGTVYVYGLTQGKQTSNNQSFSKLGLKVGDVVTLMGTRAAYNNTAQVGGPAYYVSHIASCVEPQIAFADNTVTITAEAGATIHYTTDGSVPTTASPVYAEGIVLTEGSMTVKAIAVAEGKVQSSVAERLCSYQDPNAGGNLGTPSTTTCYVLTSVSGSNNSYAGSCDITVNGIKWNLTGNSQMDPWRIGGKSITKVDRALYSKTPYPDALSKVEFVAGTSSVTTWHSLTLIYSTNADFSDAQTMSTTSVGANKTISFAPDGGFPANCYFKFVLNVTVSGTSNKYVQMSKVNFYGYDN